MRLAPHVPLTGTLHSAPDGVAGICTTVQMMRAYVKQFRTDPLIVNAARSIAFMEPAKDDEAEARAIFRFVQDHIRYVRDVLGVETLSTPITTLRTRSGDCDDQSTLLATLLEAIGFPTRFVVAAYTMPGVFEHVYLQVWVDGAWVSCDPTEPEAFGWEANDPVTVMIEKV